MICLAGKYCKKNGKEENMDAKKFIELFENADFNVRKYSGRFMYGKSCVGIEVDSISSLCGEIAEITADIDDEDLRREFARAIKKMRTDEMGLAYIAYFPQMKWPEDMIDESEDDFEDEE